jgi:hypothetical protein
MKHYFQSEVNKSEGIYNDVHLEKMILLRFSICFFLRSIFNNENSTFGLHLFIYSLDLYSYELIFHII